MAVSEGSALWIAVFRLPTVTSVTIRLIALTMAPAYISLTALQHRGGRRRALRLRLRGPAGRIRLVRHGCSLGDVPIGVPYGSPRITGPAAPSEHSGAVHRCLGRTVPGFRRRDAAAPRRPCRPRPAGASPSGCSTTRPRSARGRSRRTVCGSRSTGMPLPGSVTMHITYGAWPSSRSRIGHSLGCTRACGHAVPQRVGDQFRHDQAGHVHQVRAAPSRAARCG